MGSIPLFLSHHAGYIKNTVSGIIKVFSTFANMEIAHAVAPRPHRTEQDRSLELFKGFVTSAFGGTHPTYGHASFGLCVNIPKLKFVSVTFMSTRMFSSARTKLVRQRKCKFVRGRGENHRILLNPDILWQIGSVFRICFDISFLVLRFFELMHFLPHIFEMSRFQNPWPVVSGGLVRLT